ncbi:aluminum-activated malate transporter family protein [Marchantia polymorpha subsp. ruderalis]|uniref:Uncharacterized protein n=2 Tax=Marchantia polymorpha TaxID=3197 RepID=A0AAF6BWG4_MARPO|nr:hypothetical protein MARPO_0057s0111 [Marchantia polymorpha]BBN16348.1 hypothetical protein Mp_7g05600 [Marchantia polymorpha subsp. ruderalis]|eukprot:PTQ37510.1 hypothetical protein MARPO_0057s0111 [Marchantia polymorpha]
MADSLRQPLLNGEDQSRVNDVAPQTPQQNGNGIASGAGQSPAKDLARVESFVSRIISSIGAYLGKIGKELQNSKQPAKAGLAAALCSLLCFAPPPFHIFNRNGVWAVVTADVVLEANVGLTISKGLNRTFGTLAAAALALGVNYFAVYLGVYEPFYIMGWVFFGAGLATMFKFRRPFKDRWNYAVAMSMITFHILILSKSDYKDKVVLPLIRLATIIIGFLTMSLVNLGIAPKYAGSSINELVGKNFKKAGTVLERCVSFYLDGKVLDQVGDILTGKKQDDNIHKSFTEMVATDADCDKLLKAVPFEPCHGRFFYGYPWDMYTDVADNLRYTLYDVIALDSCLRAEIQAPDDLRSFCKEEITNIGKACAEIFNLLGESFERMRQVDCADHLKQAEDWVMLLQHKIAKHSQVILGGAMKSHSGHDLRPGDKPFQEVEVPDFDEAYPFSYSESVMNTPAQTLGYLITPTITPTHSFLANGRVVEGYQPLDEARKRELKRETKARISALSLIKFASLLIELVAKAKYLADLVTELGISAHFDSPSPPPSNVSTPKASMHHV